MDKNMRMECYSRAYVAAVAAKAGFQVAKPEVDDDSVDGVIMGRLGRRPRCEFQLKATGRDIMGAETLAFPLPIKNYNELRIETLVRRILIVLAMPDDLEEWLAQTENELALRHCAYWRSILGEPETDNTTSVTVHLSRRHMFTADAVTDIMTRIEAGEPL